MTAAERKRALAPVDCPVRGCGRTMPAGRLDESMLPVTFGICGSCRSKQVREARVPAPMYETEAWAQGVTL